MTSRTETCLFCGAAANADEAMKAGWIPEFFIGECSFSYGPVCPVCARAHLDFEYGEAVLREGHVVPTPAPIFPEESTP